MRTLALHGDHVPVLAHMNVIILTLGTDLMSGAVEVDRMRARVQEHHLGDQARVRLAVVISVLGEGPRIRLGGTRSFGEKSDIAVATLGHGQVDRDLPLTHCSPPTRKAVDHSDLGVDEKLRSTDAYLKP